MPAPRSAPWSAPPPLFNGEFIALPFAIGCGFAGGGLRELCPKEAIWHFSPFVFTSLPRRAWQMIRTLQVDWQVVLLLAPIGLELIRQVLGARWPTHLFHLGPVSAQTAASVSLWTNVVVLLASPWTIVVVLLATVLCVATPIKIWNNARIEHRLQEQEKLLLAAKIEALANQINPHFLFNTLTSISSLIRTQPETARMLITKLSGLLRRLLRATDHFVTLREELESIDEYLDIEVVRFGPQLKVVKQISPATLDVIVPSMLLQPLIENSIKHGLVAQSRRRPHHHPQRHAERPRDHRSPRRRARHDGGAPRARLRRRHRPEQRERAAAHDLRRELPAQADERAGARAPARAWRFPS